MCNLYSNTLPQEAMRQLFQARDRLGNQPPLPEAFPDMEAPIVRGGEEGRELVTARWGWSKAKFGWVTNARKLDSWHWKTVLPDVSQRCLVPADGFAEYEGPKGAKRKVWFELSREDKAFAFAGFWRRWDWAKDGARKKADAPLVEQGGGVTAFAFMTTEPNAVVAPVHPKAMPVILTEPQEWEAWLTAPAGEAATLQRPLPDDMLVRLI